MAHKNSMYITVYLLLLIPIFGISLIVRIAVMKLWNFDQFSGNIIFLGTCAFLISLYLAFQNAISACIKPVLDRYLPHKSNEGSIHNEAEVEQNNASEIILPSYKEHYDVATKKKIQENKEVLQRILEYTISELAGYVNEDDMVKLCNHVHKFQFAKEDDLISISEPIKVSRELKVIDINHYGWNIGHQFKKSGNETALFLKKVFAEKCHNIEVSTISRKLRMEGSCKIEIREIL